MESKIVTWEIVLSGDHPDIFVVFDAPDNLSDHELQNLAEQEAFRKTYIWSKKITNEKAKK